MLNERQSKQQGGTLGGCNRKAAHGHPWGSGIVLYLECGGGHMKSHK